jgi:hypothetical protein
VISQVNAGNRQPVAGFNWRRDGHPNSDAARVGAFPPQSSLQRAD